MELGVSEGVRRKGRGHAGSTGPGDHLDQGRGERQLLSGIWSFKNYCVIC